MKSASAAAFAGIVKSPLVPADGDPLADGDGLPGALGEAPDDPPADADADAVALAEGVVDGRSSAGAQPARIRSATAAMT